LEKPFFIYRKSIVQTPGELGPLEVTMVATMVGLGVPRPQALSSVILYRLATFWLPIPFRVLSCRYLSDRNFI
jgi:uncharacterized membrane protein YbhN (UPF0104 family)